MSNLLWGEPKNNDEVWETIRNLGDEVKKGVAKKDDEDYSDGRFLDMMLAIAGVSGESMTDGDCLEAITALTELWAEIHH